MTGKSMEGCAEKARRVAAQKKARRVAAQKKARRVAAQKKARRVAAQKKARRVAGGASVAGRRRACRILRAPVQTCA
jgi:hypothetical protein